MIRWLPLLALLSFTASAAEPPAGLPKEDGQILKLNDLSCSGPDSLCNTWHGFGSFTCDETACYGMGGGHAGTMTDTVFKMDFKSFKWTEMYPPTPCEIQRDPANINIPHRSYTYKGHERPISTHSYDLLALHGGYLYNMAGRGAGGRWRVCSPDELGALVREGGQVIVRMNLETLEWEWLNSLWGSRPAYYTSGYAGSVVVGDKIRIFGMGSHYEYDPVKDVKTLLGRGGTGYEVSASVGDGVVYGVAHGDNNGVVFSRSKPDGNIQTLYQNNCGIRSHWGFQWDDRNKVLGAVQEGQYKFYNPATNTCGAVAINTDLEYVTTSYHASEIVGGVFIFINPKSETYAYRIPDVSAVPPDKYGGKAVVDGVEYTSLRAAAEALKNGSRMEIAAGTYYEPFYIRASNVTVTGCGAHITGVQIGGKGAIVNQGDNNTIECLEISKVSVGDNNGAAVRHEGCGLTLRNVNFHDNQNGVLTGYDDCTTTIVGSVFRDNGYRDGRSHNLYINSRAFVFENSKSLAARTGHELKARSQYVTITGSEIDSQDSADSRLIDIPCGGVVKITNNTLRQGPQTLNRGVIGIGHENCNHPQQSIEFEGNEVSIEPGHVLFDKMKP